MDDYIVRWTFSVNDKLLLIYSGILSDLLLESISVGKTLR